MTGQRDVPPSAGQLRMVALDEALHELHIGAGEVGGNNRGPFVSQFLARAGLTPPQPWCAAFVSWCYAQAAIKLGIALPFTYTASALGLFHQCQDKGWQIHTFPSPGDLMFWHRGYANSGLGHVGIIEAAHDGKIQTVEGNHGAQVARYHYQGDLPTFIGWVRIPG